MTITFKHGNEHDNVMIMKSETTVCYGYGGNDVVIDSLLTSDDLIFGEGGNDIVFSSDGADMMWGGKGDDIFYISVRTGEVQAVGNGGFDTVILLDRDGADLNVVQKQNTVTVTDDNGFELTLRSVEHIDWSN